MKAVYRNNALGPKDFNIDDQYEREKDTIIRLVDRDFKQMSRPEYLDWVDGWKCYYRYIQSDIIHLKTQQKFDRLNRWKVLANTLLNARQYAKSIRRQEAHKSGR